MNRNLFNLLWMASLFLRLAHENRFTYALNQTFFWDGVSWIFFDIGNWILKKLREREAKDIAKKVDGLEVDWDFTPPYAMLICKNCRVGWHVSKHDKKAAMPVMVDVYTHLEKCKRKS